ncbi:MAG: HNH endonuclease [Opitutales bacterium]|nr:HNH endonuclease [Opitutales bacterium]MCH8540420.1 HNH endonuclease [Opitutales bacterium]
MSELVLSHQVLVLNRLWQAVNVVDVRRAFCLLSQDHAKVLHEEDETFRVFNTMEWFDFSKESPDNGEDLFIHTVRQKIRLPQIILLTVFDKLPSKELKFTRNNVFERDKHRCQYCGKKFERKELNLDHVIPRDYGGKTSWENIVCSCVPCNMRKANRLPHEAGMRLVREPAKPKWRPFVSTIVRNPAYKSWRHFLDVAYWNVELDEG